MTIQPPDPLSMRASDSDRHAVADILGSAYAEGRLSLPEYHERLDALMQTTTYGELVPFVLDLPNVDDRLPMPIRRDKAHTTPSNPGATVPSRAYGRSGGRAVGSTVAVMSENKKRGNMHLDGGATVVAVMGEALLDLSRATFSTADIHITVNAVMGKATVVVPADAVVTVGVVPIMGNVSSPENVAPTTTSANPPRITLKGAALMGEVAIERALPPFPPASTPNQLDR
jgi:hypothetical protein